MRRLLAVAALATTAAVSVPAHAAYTCLPEDSDVAVCAQVVRCMDVCVLKPGAYVECYLGLSGEEVCRIVRLVGVEVGG